MAFLKQKIDKKSVVGNPTTENACKILQKCNMD